jgi:hypothetical protein
MPAAEFMRSIGRPIEVLLPPETLDRAGAKRSDPRPAVVTELRTNGFSVDTVADLFNKRLQYEAAIPILLKWLPRVDDVLKGGKTPSEIQAARA